MHPRKCNSWHVIAQCIPALSILLPSPSSEAKDQRNPFRNHKNVLTLIETLRHIGNNLSLSLSAYFRFSFSVLLRLYINIVEYRVDSFFIHYEWLVEVMLLLCSLKIFLLLLLFLELVFVRQIDFDSILFNNFNLWIDKIGTNNK